MTAATSCINSRIATAAMFLKTTAAGWKTVRRMPLYATVLQRNASTANVLKRTARNIRINAEAIKFVLTESVLPKTATIRPRFVPQPRNACCRTGFINVSAARLVRMKATVLTGRKLLPTAAAENVLCVRKGLRPKRLSSPSAPIRPM